MLRCNLIEEKSEANGLVLHKLTITKKVFSRHLIKVTLAYLVVIFSCLNILASSVSYSVTTLLDISTYDSEQPISRYLSSYVDKEGKFGIEDILELEKSKWLSTNIDIPNHGLTSNSYWYRLDLWNDTPTSREFYLSLELPTLDNYQVYTFVDGYMIEKYTLGDSIEYKNRVIDNRNFVIPLLVPTKQKVTLFLRFKSFDSLQIPLYLKEPIKFYSNEQSELLFIGMFIGVMIVMGLYNLFLFISVRDKNYLFFSLFILSAALFQITRSGVGFQYLWSSTPLLNIYLIPISSSLMSVWMNLFLYEFLIIKESSQFNQRLLQYQILAALFIPLVNMYSYAMALNMIVVLGGFFPIAAIFITISRYYDGLKYARLLMVGLLILFSTILLLTLNKAGFAPRIFLSEFGFEVGSVITVILMSLALAQKISSVSDKIINAEHKALKNERKARVEKERYLKLKIAAKDDEILTREEIVIARAESKAKSDFLAVMSHEIRTPMNGVLGMAEILSSTELSAKQRHYVKIIEDSGKSLVKIINDILDFSKIEAGKVELESIDFDLNKLCQQCFSSFSLDAQNKQIETVLTIQTGTPIYLNSDPTRIKQILLNLLSNAFKFTSSGRITLTVSMVESSEISAHQHLIKFSVTDTGIGIPENNKKKLFDKFSQTDSSTTRNFGGTGLGLAICKKLTNLLGGEIDVNTFQQVGVTFWFTVRVTDANEQFIQKHYIANDLLKNKRLLFVDSSSSFIESAKELKSSWEADVDFANSSAEFKLMLKQSYDDNMPFDIICIDMSISGKTALECAEIVNETDEYKDSKLLFLSALNDRLDNEFLYKKGIKNLVEKPASAEMLLESFLELLEQGSITEKRINKQSIDSIVLLEKLSGKIALVVEDNTTNQIVIKKMLDKLGIISHLVVDGQQAYSFVTERNAELDFVLMDCEMPNMDGYQSTQLIREWEQKHQLTAIPIIALTAHALLDHRQKALDSGMDFHVTKPINIKTLSETIGLALNITTA